MFDGSCSDLSRTFYDAILDLVRAKDFDELAPDFYDVAKNGGDVCLTDDGLAIICGEAEYSVSIERLK